MLQKAIQQYVTRYLAVWELDIIQPPLARAKATGSPTAAQPRTQQRLIAAAREQADFFFSLLPLASLKTGFHPAPGSCLWIYALTVDQIAGRPDFKPRPDYETHYSQLNAQQQQTERSAFIGILRSIPERTVHRLTQTGPAPYWVAKPLFPTPASTRTTKETSAPGRIWRLNSFELQASKIDNANTEQKGPGHAFL
jgi:hypothetical protein